MGRPWWYDSYWKKQGDEPSRYQPNIARRKPSRPRRNTARNVLLRILLNLTILAGLAALARYGYMLFTHELNPLIGSIVFLLGITTWILLIGLIRRRYSMVKPSFKLTTFSVIMVLIVFTFAGMQPLAGYNDVAIGKITNFINEQELKAEERRVAEEERRAIEKAEMDAAGVVSEYDFYKEYVVFFNEFRSENGRPRLIFNTALNELAAERALEISRPGHFSHQGIKKYNFGENIAMMAYSSDSASNLIEMWASSPGHRSNMLLYSYHRTGFAKNGKYAVQIFD